MVSNSLFMKIRDIMKKITKTTAAIRGLLEAVAEKNTAQQLLFKCIVSPNSNRLALVLLKPEVDINYIYKYRHVFKYNIFQILCAEIMVYKKENLTQYRLLKKEFVACGIILLNNGLDIFYPDNLRNNRAIEFAILSGEIELVRHVIAKYDSRKKSYFARHLYCTVITHFKDSKFVDLEYMEILELLMEKGVDINCFDFNTGEPAIYQAAKFKLADAVHLFITKFYDTIDIDWYIDKQGKSARNLILKYKLFSRDLPSRTQSPYHKLFEGMIVKDFHMFIENYRILESSLSYHTKVMLLFRALNIGSSESFAFLLDEVSFKFKHYLALLEVACVKGYYLTVDSLLEAKDIIYDIHLVKKIVTINKAVKDETNTINHLKCLSLILEETTINLNEKDEFNMTVVEYAIKHKNPKMIIVLLQNGASLIIRDGKEFRCVVSQINPIIIEEYFNASATTEEEGKQIMKYTISPSKRKIITYDYSIDYMGVLAPRELAPQRPYLPEMMVFDSIANHSEYLSLLGHPFTLVFVAMKWYRLRYFFYVDSIIDLIFTVLLNAYLLNFRLSVFYVTICIMFGLLVLWELVQVVMFGKDYFYFLDNIWKIFLLILTSAVVTFHHFLEEHNLFTLQLFAAVAFVSVLNLFIILGNYPKCSTSVMMIRSVYISLLKAFFTYAVLMLAFASCMFVLFEGNKIKLFGNYGSSIFKTIIMTTGDLTVDKLELPSKPLGYFIIALFILLIPIGLFNLLTGIAVSDIQEIRKNSRTLSQKIRVNQITKIERIFLKPWIVKYFPCCIQVCLFTASDLECKTLLDTNTRIVSVKGKPGTFKMYKSITRLIQSKIKTED